MRELATNKSSQEQGTECTRKRPTRRGMTDGTTTVGDMEAETVPPPPVGGVGGGPNLGDTVFFNTVWGCQRRPEERHWPAGRINHPRW